jgi:hypothetical protein
VPVRLRSEDVPVVKARLLYVWPDCQRMCDKRAIDRYEAKFFDIALREQESIERISYCDHLGAAAPIINAMPASSFSYV